MIYQSMLRLKCVHMVIFKRLDEKLQYKDAINNIF